MTHLMDKLASRDSLDILYQTLYYNDRVYCIFTRPYTQRLLRIPDTKEISLPYVL